MGADSSQEKFKKLLSLGERPEHRWKAPVGKGRVRSVADKGRRF